MSKLLSSKLGMVAGLAALLTAAVVVAQNEPTRPGQTTRPGTTAQGTGSSQVDRQLAAWLIVENENEIALSQLAQQRAKNEDVQEFAQKMVDEHQQFLTKLQKYSPWGKDDRRRDILDRDRDEKSPKTNGTSATQPGTTRPGQVGQPGQPGQPGQVGQPGQGGQSGQLDIVSLKRELGEQCLQSARRELERRQGADFDRAYIGGQIVSHMISLDTMKVFKRHASGDLQKVLNEGIETAQAHLDEARNIYKKLDNGASKGSQRDRTSESK